VRALDRPQLPGVERVRPWPGERVLAGSRPSLLWESRLPEAIVDFNAVLGRVADRSVA
jgi:hypothetical protein